MKPGQPQAQTERAGRNSAPLIAAVDFTLNLSRDNKDHNIVNFNSYIPVGSPNTRTPKRLPNNTFRDIERLA